MLLHRQRMSLFASLTFATILEPVSVHNSVYLNLHFTILALVYRFSIGVLALPIKFGCTYHWLSPATL